MRFGWSFVPLRSRRIPTGSEWRFGHWDFYMRRYFFILVFAFILPLVINAAEPVETFYIDPGFDSLGRSQIKAVLKTTGQQAYFFIEKNWWEALSLTRQKEGLKKIQALSQEFDNTIYLKEREVFGQEWSPGIDEDRRITILLSELIPRAGGYFNPEDEYSQEKILRSNEKEMVYLNASYLFDARLLGFLAHEFQHLITHNQKIRLRGIEEEIWLNEARSEYAPTLCGYDTPYAGSNLENRVQKFLNSPSDSLTEWQNVQDDYGPVNLFIRYLVEHYSQDLLTSMMRSEKVGIASIEEALVNVGSPDSFSDVFTYWSITNLVNDCSLEPQNRFCYLNPELTYERLHIAFGPPTTYGEELTSILTTTDWSANYHQFTRASGDSTKDLEVNFQFSEEEKFRVPYILYSNGEPTIHYINFKEGEGEFTTLDFGNEISKVVIIPSSQKKLSGFYGIEVSRQYRLSAKLAPPLKFGIRPSGSLIRVGSSPKVYITQGKYKRWIQTAKIFNSYTHLKWEDIKEVTQEELDFYEEVSLIRVTGQEKVYEINNDGTSHWLKITAKQFLSSGRAPEMIFEINQSELDLYEPGTNIVL